MGKEIFLLVHSACLIAGWPGSVISRIMINTGILTGCWQKQIFAIKLWGGMQWDMVSGGKCTADPNRREEKDGAGFGVFFPPLFFFLSQQMQEPVISCWRQWPWSFSNIQVNSFSSAASICRAGPLADVPAVAAGSSGSSCHSWICLNCFARCVGGYKRSQGGKPFPGSW